MSVFLSPVGGAGAQFFDNNGNPLTGGKLYTYAAGTTTPAATYISSAGTTVHSNPIVLDAAGRIPGSSEVWLTDSVAYKFVLKTSDDVLLATWDNITGVNSNFVNFAAQEEVQTATAGQTVFTLTTITYSPGSNNLQVFVDGVNQIVNDSYVETNSNTVTFTAGLHVGALVKFTTAVSNSSGIETDAALVTYDPPFTGSESTTVETKLAQTVSVWDFIPSGTDTSTVDCTQYIQNALDHFATNNVKGVVNANGVFKVDGNLTLNATYVRLNGENAVFNCSAASSGASITITGEDGAIPYNQVFGGITGVELIGPGKAVSGVIGLLFESTNEAGPSHSTYYGVNVSNFETGHKFQKNAYCISFFNSDVWGCATGVFMPDGYSNYGERIEYSGCTIFNNDFGVVNSNSDGAFYFIGSSLDYNGVQAVAQKGRIYLTTCHIESSSYASPPFVTYPNNGATIVINGGWMLCTGTNTSTIFESQTTQAQGGGIFVRDVFINNMGPSAKWKQGSGRFELTNPISFNTSNNPQFASQYENLLIDGGFEGTSVWDAVITADTAPITSRTTGANISLTNSTAYYKSGAKSLAATKTFGGGSSAGFQILAPLSKPGNLGTYKGFYKKPGSQTGTMFLSHVYVNMQVNNGIPVVAKNEIIGAVTVNFTSSAVDWTEVSTGEPMVHSPSWATHIAIQVNMDGMNAGAVYFDDFEFFEY